MHVRADRLDGCPLPRVQSLIEQRAQTVLAAVLLQADHRAADEVGQDGPEVLPCSALDFIDTQVSGPVFRSCPVPRLENRSFRPACGPPAHEVPAGALSVDRHDADAGSIHGEGSAYH